MRCKSCNTRQHAGCYGHLHYNSTGVIVQHVCWLCLFGETLQDDAKRRELCDMARLRRAMSLIWACGFRDKKTLAAQLDCSQANAQRIVGCLMAWQFLKATPGVAEGEKAYSVATEGEEKARFMKWFIGGDMDYRILI